mgnify:CR=1 FL=1
MDDLFLWAFGIITFLAITYGIIASIVNKIKEPYEAKAELIDLEKEKEKYDKLSKEAKKATKQAEEAKRNAEIKSHSAEVEANRYLALKENLVSRYNKAKDELDVSAHRKALEMLSYSNDLLLDIAPKCDIAELHESILEGRLLKAFEAPPKVSNVKISALVKSPNDTYTTTLTDCTCRDFHFRNHPCKHMLYLYYILGMVNIDKPVKDDAIRVLNLTISDISQSKALLKRLNTAKKNLEVDIRDLKKKKISVSEDIEDFNETLRNKYARFPQVAKIIAEKTIQHYYNAEQYLINKSRPAYSAADTVKLLSKETKLYVKELAELRLKLAYIEDMFPNINDVFEPGFNGEDDFVLETKENTDRVRLFLSPEEYKKLSTIEKNQLALNRYVESRKSKWQIGRDYEMFIGNKLESEGFTVSYTGIIEKLEDMGRDLIATKGQEIYIIQCKNWSQEKTIHEKHIFQLYGTVVLWKLDNPLSDVHGAFVTSTKLSEKAKMVAAELGIKITENLPLGDFPRIKCNINRTTGEKIYHLPFDQQYDAAVIDTKKGECYAFTVAEAEAKGFRRAWRHFS